MSLESLITQSTGTQNQPVRDITVKDLAVQGELTVTSNVVLTAPLQLATLTTTQRNALSPQPPAGSIIYNSTTETVQVKEVGGDWASVNVT
jgi:hypothetical protein